MGRGRKAKARRNKRKQKALAKQQEGQGVVLAQKSNTSSFGSLFSDYGYAPDVDLTRTKWGAAIAHNQVHQIMICTTILVNAVTGLPWTVMQYRDGVDKEGTVIASSEDLFPTHPFVVEMKKFRQENGQSLLATIMFDRTVYGEVVIERSFEQTEQGIRKRLDWLNPLGVSVETDQDGIKLFRYGWDNQYEIIPERKVAYMHTRNPFDDYIGYSRVMAVMAKINIERNFDRYLRDFFKNNALPGLITMPVDRNSSLSQLEQERLTQKLRSQFKGLGKQFNTIVLPTAMDFEKLENADVSRQYSISSEVGTAIFEGMGVPQAMAGNTANLSAFQTDNGQAMRNFFLGTIKPETAEIEQYINTEIMPFYDPSLRTVFHFDTSRFDEVSESDKLEAEVIGRQISDTLIDLYTAAKKQEIDAPDALKGLYKVNGDIVPLAELRTWAEKKLLVAPSVFNSEIITDTPLPQPTNAGDVIPTTTGGEPVADELPPAEQERIESETVSDVVVQESGEDDEPTEQKACSRGGDCKSSHPTINHIEWDEFDYEYRQRKELKAWAKFEKNIRAGKSKRRPFVCASLPNYLRYAAIDTIEYTKDANDLSKALSYDALMQNPVVKNIASYQRGLRSNARGLWGGVIPKEQFVTNINRLIEVQFREAFNDGVERGGLQFSDLTDEQQAVMGELIGNEQAFVDTLADAIEEKNRASGGKLASIQGRVDRWTSRFSGVEQQGFVISKANSRLLWKYDPSKENCIDCKRLNGKIKLGRQWAAADIHPKSSKLNCFGINCGCEFVDTDDPLSRGRLPRLVGPR